MPGILPGMLTTDQLVACTGARPGIASTFLLPLDGAMRLYAINTPARMAMFLANLGHESLGLNRLTESLNYSVDALIGKFGRHRISLGDANAYGRTPDRRAAEESIANCIYGGAWGAKYLGNDQPGDGWRYRGRGPTQTTGKANYQALTERLQARYPNMGVPSFVKHPELLTDPVWGSLAAADYWDMRNLNAYADRGDFDGVCDLVNLGRKTSPEGDSDGWTQRVKLWVAATKALTVAA